jgi:chaperonin cofactor prefoldin
MHSKAIEKLEDEELTLEKLFETNRGGYRIINSKVKEISKNIIKILKD